MRLYRYWELIMTQSSYQKNDADKLALYKLEQTSPML